MNNKPQTLGDLNQLEDRALAARTSKVNYFETFSECLDGIAARLVVDEVSLVDSEWRCTLASHYPVNYEQTLNRSFEIASRKGKNTRAWFHLNIYRTSQGRYELNTYVL